MSAPVTLSHAVEALEASDDVEEAVDYLVDRYGARRRDAKAKVMAAIREMHPTLQGADEVIFAPTEQLLGESLEPNRKKRKRFEEPPPELLEMYGGYEGFLVRTALIRAADYDPAKALRIATPDDAWPLIKHLGFADQEHIVVICVSNQNALLAIHETAVGGTASVQVQVRHAVKVPLLVGAASAIICHNHPSGSASFSPEDIVMTKSFKQALDCVGVGFLDHILVTRGRMVSYVDKYGASP